MPIHTCKLPNGENGYQWGSHGKCFADRKEAERQAEAAHANGFTGDGKQMKFYTESALGETRKLTPEGFLVVENVPIARIGSMDYHDHEVDGIEADDTGMIKMSRTADELFSLETIASFEGKPIIIPTEDVHTNGVDSDTWDKHAVGHIQGVRADGEFLKADLIINDSNAIDRVNQGLRELSCGYEYMARQVSPGRGEQYEIRGNHVALVERARGGNQLKIGDTGNIMKIKNPLLRLFAHAVKAGDEEAQKDIEEKMDEDNKDEKEVKTGDEGDEMATRMAALEEKLDKCMETIHALVASKAGDDDTNDDDDTNMAGDAEWQEVIAGAAILSPSLTIEKKGKIGDAMAQILKQTETAIVKRFVGDSLDPKSIQILFASAVESQKVINNAKQHAGDAGMSLTFSGLDNGGFEIVGR